MATFGKTTVGANSVGYNTGTKRGSKYQLTEAGTVTAISLYATGVSGSVKFAIYDDDGTGGAPGTKIWADDTGQTMVNGWNTKNGLSISLQPGWYWLCWMTSASHTAYYDSPGNRAWNTQVYTDPWPSSWGSTSTGTDRDHSIYCTYTPSGGQTYEIYVDAIAQSLATPIEQCTFNVEKDASVASQSQPASETTFHVLQDAIAKALADLGIETTFSIEKDAIVKALADVVVEKVVGQIIEIFQDAITQASASPQIQSTFNINPEATVKVLAEVVILKEGEIKVTKLFFVLGNLAIQIQGI
jgi:hypothetical protein